MYRFSVKSSKFDKRNFFTLLLLHDKTTNAFNKVKNTKKKLTIP